MIYFVIGTVVGVVLGFLAYYGIVWYVFRNGIR